MDWPSDLVSDIARRRCVLFIGAGISRNSENSSGRRPKTWGAFLRDAAGALTSNAPILDLIARDDFLTACEVIRTRMGRDDFVRLLRDEYLTPKYAHAKIHEHIFRIDSRIVVTPNFDKIYETYANYAANSSIVVKHHYDPDVANIIRDDGRVILKIHGSIDAPDRMIFTRSEYAKARNEHREFYHLIDVLAMTHTFLFLGTGVNDPDMRLLLEDAFFRHPWTRRHVMTVPTGELDYEVASVIERTMNLKIIRYSPANYHEELTVSAQGLAAAVEAKREELRSTLNW
jgi:hypothetical protein